MHASFEILVAVIVVPALLRAKVLEHRFATWRDESRLPAAVVLIPQRNPGVGAVAAVARRYGIPSVAAEPHVYVPEYSRYNKVPPTTTASCPSTSSTVPSTTSAWAVVTASASSVHLASRPRRVRAAAAHEQGPRQVRERHGFDFTKAPVHLVFFCQPSGWEHVAKLWDLLLDGVETVRRPPVLQAAS